mgnify:CR=1 FL=1
MFRDYLLCNDVLNYLMRAYDNSINSQFISGLIDHGVKEGKIIKALNELFNVAICGIINYVLGAQIYISHEMPEEVLREIDNSILIILKLSDDCTYLGLTNSPT